MYFNNAIREEIILKSSKDGVVLLPGGYGTILELFIALEYHHIHIDQKQKLSLVFFNSNFLKTILAPQYLKSLHVTDDIQEVLDIYSTHGGNI